MVRGAKEAPAGPLPARAAGRAAALPARQGAEARVHHAGGAGAGTGADCDTGDFKGGGGLRG